MSIRSNTKGDRNIILQDIDSSQIKIEVNKISGGGLPPETAEEKERLKEKILDLLDRLDDLKHDFKPETTEGQISEESEENIEEILEVMADGGNCVLFVGPEIAREDKNRPLSLHEQKFRALPNEIKNLSYNENDGFFDPFEGSKLRLKMRRYYRKKFSSENKLGKQVLTELLSLPFRLIVNMSPDESVHETLAHFDRDHHFDVFKEGTSFQDIKPTIEKPLVLNALGSVITNEGEFVFTQADFYRYIKSAELSSEVKNQLKTAHHLFFIGFDFQRWYTRLLLFMLNIEGDDNERTHLSHTTQEEIRSFLEKQFNITEVQTDYLSFCRYLIHEAGKQEEKIVKPLPCFFLEKQELKLEAIARQTIDTKELSRLHVLNEEISAIEEKIKHYEEGY